MGAMKRLTGGRLTCGVTYDGTREGWWRWQFAVYPANVVKWENGQRVVIGSKPLLGIPLTRWKPLPKKYLHL